LRQGSTRGLVFSHGKREDIFITRIGQGSPLKEPRRSFMALIINHNLPAMVAARNLGSIYDSLGKSIERLSSGLRINKAADDAAGLAVREMMRADIATTMQGIRNAADAVSMIQTADGALGVIDAKLIRMKELAEQAATGTYTDFQREIINSEYQAMAAEIDRIANATNFNGIKLLDGSTLSANGGSGIRIHFGVNNNAGEDYYYVTTGNVRATDPSGLNIGGDATNDIWSTGGLPGTGIANCCGGAIPSLATVVSSAGQGLTLAYNWDSYSPAVADNGSSLVTADAWGRSIMGRYANVDGSNTTLGQLVDLVNDGSQSRVLVTISGGTVGTNASAGGVLCLSTTEAYYVGSATAAGNQVGGFTGRDAVSAGATTATAADFASAINSNADSSYWALADSNNLWVFRKQGGDFNSDSVGFKSTVAGDNDNVIFTNIATEAQTKGLGELSLGGESWITAEHVAEGGGYNLVLNGRDVGDGKDIRVANAGNTAFATALSITAPTNGFFANIQSGLLQRQNAESGRGDIRTQEAAQTALTNVTRAIEQKDKVRANLGAMQNRLEATIENLTIQAENLQASESRISDVDVATEMTAYTKNNILAQAAASMLAQANSLSSLALILING
jgi:flagellin